MSEPSGPTGRPPGTSPPGTGAPRIGQSTEPTSGPGRQAAGDDAPGPARPYGKYFLVQKLAVGGMAEIFLAKQSGPEGFERDVVIKRMLGHLTGAPEFVEMFLDEARLAARLAHPNIVQIHDLGLAEGCYYICMEHLAGEDFSTVVRRTAKAGQYVPLPIVAKVIADSARGLEFAHDFTDQAGKPLQIVHRDVSPANLFVTYQGQVKVLDFGIARAESRLTQTRDGMVKGKYMYMAPEQARGGDVDRRADVFSLGVSLYEAVTHVRPFARDTQLGILNAVLAGDFKPPRAVRKELPAELEAIILRAMASDRAERYQSAGELASALETFVAGRMPTNRDVAGFLRGIFGEERISRRSRIPALASLGMATSPVAPALSEEVKTSPSSPASLAAPAASAAAPRSRRTVQLAGALGLAAVIAAGAFAVLRAGSPRPAPQPVEVAATPAAPPPAVVPPAPTPTPAPAAAPAPVASTVEEPPAPAAAPARRREPTRPVVLDAAMVQKVVSRDRTLIAQCFQTFKSELPSDSGQVTVTFSIRSTGKVTKAEVAGPLSGTRVAGCLTERVRRLKFPAHQDEELTLALPFAYQVER